MSSVDVATWLAEYGSYNRNGGCYDWDYAAIIREYAPASLAATLIRAAATESGTRAALALDAVLYGVGLLAEVCGDSSNAHPGPEGSVEWLNAFTDAVLAAPAFIRNCALVYVPPLALGEQYFVDRRADAYLAKHRESALDRVEAVAFAITNEMSRTEEDCVRIWLPIRGGTLGMASELVRQAEITAFHPNDRRRRPAVVELRQHLVDVAHDVLIAGVPFWARAWIVEHLALVDRALLEDLLAHEQEPWLAAQMRFELALSAAERQQRWASWLG
jgi:hypothetical protein